MNTIDLEVQGMSCGSCVNHVTQALKPLRGVSDVAVDLQAGRVHVHSTLDAGAETLISALAAAGYPAKLVTAGASLAQRPATEPKARRGSCCGS
ncbi:MAG: heavy-metal-associated domain-containing protein [Burkholderiales bacterium]|nr:heavy-metal-associated domain-containing protein [Burkholderiales bacterium]